MGEQRNCAITNYQTANFCQTSCCALQILSYILCVPSALNYTHRCPLFSESHWHSLQLIAIDGKFWKGGCSMAPVHDDLLWYICRNFPLCNAFSRVHYCIAAAGRRKMWYMCLSFPRPPPAPMQWSLMHRRAMMLKLHRHCIDRRIFFHGRKCTMTCFHKPASPQICQFVPAWQTDNERKYSF